MTSKLFLLLAGTALAASLTTAFAAPHLLSQDGMDRSDAARIFLIDSDDDDEDDDDDHHNRRGNRHHDDDDDDDDCEEDDDDGLLQDCGLPVIKGGAPIAPPNNGLFQNGSKPTVTVK